MVTGPETGLQVPDVSRLTDPEVSSPWSSLNANLRSRDIVSSIG
ncbi:hypothetical protein Rhow_004506 [Rhodococcus wratislaviensis]|uniref:Uncharacterized protein n=1 Tax=Rhodococcus wratislaviensis TaxID=44752 RepID=A0A402CBC3_RHOWR|nr:hypothetical protein Rhow_004506 [Rhodococcus wratislaviensis]